MTGTYLRDGMSRSPMSRSNYWTADPVCAPSKVFQTLPRAELQNWFFEETIPNFDFRSLNYEYMLSMWLYLETMPQPIPNEAIFFILRDSFSLSFDSPTTFKVHIKAIDSREEVISEPVEIPLNSWFNLQLFVVQSKGIRVRIFNEKSELQTQMTMNTRTMGRKLGRQRPAGFFHTLKTFRGMVKSIVLWDRYNPRIIVNGLPKKTKG